MDLASNPAFTIYAVCCVIWVANLIGLGSMTAVARGASKKTLNREDLTDTSELVTEEPERLVEALDGVAATDPLDAACDTEIT